MAMTFEKNFGEGDSNYTIRVGEPWPRNVWLYRGQEQLFRLGLEEARDLHYALGRLIALADENDKK